MVCHNKMPLGQMDDSIPAAIMGSGANSTGKTRPLATSQDDPILHAITGKSAALAPARPDPEAGFEGEAAPERMEQPVTQPAMKQPAEQQPKLDTMAQRIASIERACTGAACRVHRESPNRRRADSTGRNARAS